MIGAAMLHRVFVQPFGAACHRIEHDHAVAVVDIHDLHYRAELVRGIVFAVAEHIIALTVVTIHIAVDYFLAQVVHIAAAAMHHRAEQPLADHVEDHKLTPAVAAIFEHHAVDARFLICMNKAEAIIYIISAADLRADTLSGAHGGDAHFDVRFPRGKDEHRFHIGAVNYLVPIGSAKRMLAGFFENRFFARCGA